MALKIIDIANIDIATINKAEIFALDTNILYWTHYSKASDPNLGALPYQVLKYPNFVQELLDNGNTLVTTVLNISELIHVVENSEYKIYKAFNKRFIKKKDFRNLSSERIKYKNELIIIMSELKEAYGNQIKIIDIKEKYINNYISKIESNICDIFDYLVIEKLKKEGINNFITDDKDFRTVDGINLFTAYNW